MVAYTGTEPGPKKLYTKNNINYWVKEMYQPEELTSCVRGVHAAFVLVDDALMFSTLNIDLSYLSRTIYLLKMCLEKKCTVTKVHMSGQKKDIVLYLDNEVTMGVMVSKDANLILLHRTVFKIISHLKQSIENTKSQEDTVQRVRNFFTST